VREVFRRRQAKAGRANEDYREWAYDEGHVGNPPESELLSREIDRLSREFPEVSFLEREQAEIYREAYEQGPRWSYPEHEGPGFTGRPVDWEGWHRDHNGWTFTEWAEARGYSLEWIDQVNNSFRPDPRELQYARQRDARWAGEAAEARPFPYAEVIPEPEPDHVFGSRDGGGRYHDDREAGNCNITPEPVPEPEAPGLLRIVPMRRPWELEIRSEPDPYDPLQFPSYSYWPRAREAGEL
jgi:hypothetical protein